MMRRQLVKKVESTRARTMTFGAALCVVMMSGLTWTVGDGFHMQRVHAQQDASTRIDTISDDLTRIERNTIDVEIVSEKFSAEDRLGDARIAHELKQYDRAGFLFLDVISRTSPSDFVGYREALYFLADSLYQQRNYVGARNYLKELRNLGPGAYYQEGLAKTLEVAYAMNNYEGIETIYDQLGSSDTPALNYLRGKTLYDQERYAEASNAFMKAAQANEEFRYKGTYYAGVSLVQLEKYDEATQRFSSLIERVPERIEDFRIYNLAHMALGRLAYEQENYEEALNHYASVARRSDSFISAMYESAWTNIQLGKYQQAGQVIDILISAEPDVDTYTAAMLLKADLSQRTEEYDTALQTYDELLTRYDPVRDQLFLFAGQHSNLREFFRGLVQDDLSIRMPEGLPNVRTDFATMSPSQWLSEDTRLERTRALIDDVTITRVNLRSAQEDLRQIEARLSSGGTLKSFPKLAADTAQVLSLESKLLDIQRELIDTQAASITPRLSGSDAERWKEIRQELDLLASRYADIPADINALKSRQDRVERDFADLRQRFALVSTELDGLRAELAAIDTYTETQALLLSEEERARVDELREELRAAMSVLKEEETTLRSEIAVARESASGGDTLSNPERALRSKYRESLASAADFLSRRKGSASNPSALVSVERAQAKVGPLHARIQGYYSKMDGLVGDRTRDVNTTVANLKRSLAEEERALEDAVQTGKLVAGDLAYRAFLDRAAQFDQVVLRADVGKIDVLFTQKESTTEEINDLYQKRTDELRELQEAFDELR